VRHSLVAVAVLAVVLSGCQRKAEGQTVAVVNGREITIPELNFALSEVKIPDSADKNVVRSQILQKIIDRRLLADEARKEGIDKTPEYLNRQRQMGEDLLISMLAPRRMNTAQLPSDREVDTYIASNPQAFASREEWALNQVLYPTQKDPAIAAEIAKTKTMDDLIAVLQQHKVSFSRQTNHLDTAVIPPQLYSKINALPAGEPFAFPVGDRTIASSITNRESKALTGDQAKPIAVQAMRKAQTAKSLEDLLKSLRGTAKIEYQPGFAPKS
jgi:peptidyl-prolyl cis-trans isomerase C